MMHQSESESESESDTGSNAFDGQDPNTAPLVVDERLLVDNYRPRGKILLVTSVFLENCQQ
jgi:hypothetical protein